MADLNKKLRKLVNSSRRIVILGTGKTGYSLALVFANTGRLVTLLDEREVAPELLLEFKENGINCAWQDEALNYFSVNRKLDFVVKSPGIPSTSKLVQAASKAKIKFVSELDLYSLIAGKPTVAVTGTNGKTTVASLIHQMLVHAGARSRVMGNIGRPLAASFLGPLMHSGYLSAKLRGDPRDVIEVSSYQLDDAKVFAPKIGVWLNLGEDHLERHGEMEQYARVKAKIFANQNSSGDWALLNIDDPYAEQTSLLSQGTVFPFGLINTKRKSFSMGCFYDPSSETVTFLLAKTAARFDLSRTPLLGFHNRINLTAAIAASMLAGASVGAIQEVINKFCSLPHRLELVRSINGVKYINDSKATNVSSALASLSSIAGSCKAKLFLLLGGAAKEGNWGSLARRLGEEEQDRNIEVSLFGGSGPEIAMFLASAGYPVPKERVFESLAEAFFYCYSTATAGDIVLLAPGCASFDAYKNFEARGEDFRCMVDRASAGLLTA